MIKSAALLNCLDGYEHSNSVGSAMNIITSILRIYECSFCAMINIAVGEMSEQKFTLTVIRCSLISMSLAVSRNVRTCKVCVQNSIS